MRSIHIAFITAFFTAGCKDESNPKAVQYNGPIALRSNYARPTVFKLSTKLPDGKLKITETSCDNIGDKPPFENRKNFKCYIMKRISKKMRSTFADMARFVLTKKDSFEVNGRTAGTVVDLVSPNIISLTQNHFALVRDGPDICMDVISANTGYVKADAFANIIASKPSNLKSTQFSLDWMTFSESEYLYNFVDFTESSIVDERLKKQEPVLFSASGPNLAWSMKASRHFTVRVCQSTIDNSVIVDGGVVFKIAIN